MSKKLKAPVLRPYNIVEQENEAEITMYGEVVETQPVDWWTGEPVDGLYIILSEFLNDIDRLNNMEKITVRINSVGGDLEAGVAIYNRLKGMKNVTTIVDGLAASAASLIAQAGSNRQVYSSSQMMAHQASTMIYGSYNSTELSAIKDMLDAANNQVISIYVETTGQTETKLRHMVEKTTWMTGQEIIDNGFADEIVDGNIQMTMSADKRLFLCNGIPMNYKRLASIPDNVVVDPKLTKAQTANADANKTKSHKEETKMTLDELKEQCPDLVNAIREEAKAEASATMADASNSAVEAERARIREIEEIENSIADKELVNKAKFTEPMNARDLAFEAMKNQAAIGNQMLKNMEEDAEASNTDSVEAGTPAEPTNDEIEKAETAKIIEDGVKAANALKGGRK